MTMHGISHFFTLHHKLFTRPLALPVRAHLVCLTLLLCVNQTQAANQQPPEANWDAVTIIEGLAVQKDLPIYDSDATAYPLRAELIDPPSKGSADVQVVALLGAGRIKGSLPTYRVRVVYNPDPGQTGVDQFSWRVGDANLWSSPRSTTITINSRGPNLPPQIPSTESLQVAANASNEIRYASYDQDSGFVDQNEFDEITYTCQVLDPPSQGTVTFSPRGVSIENMNHFKKWKFRKNLAVTYTSDPGSTGEDSFRYRIFDGVHWSEASTVEVSITDNRPPMAYNCTLNFQRGVDGFLTQSGRSHLVRDPDIVAGSTQELTYTVLTPPAHGSLDGLEYTPNPEFLGTDSFVWQVSDGVATARATTQVLVRSVTDPAGASIVVVATQKLINQAGDHINRLVTDLAVEGWSAELVPWTGGKAADLHALLFARFTDASRHLEGAIFIGASLPLARTWVTSTLEPVWANTDSPYWMMEPVLSDQGRLGPGHIWVSRFATDNAKQLRAALDANHRYRTGQSRLPLKAWQVIGDRELGGVHAPETVAQYLAICEDAEQLETKTLKRPFTEGGEFLFRLGHNAPGLPNAAHQSRFVVVSGCQAGSFKKVGAYPFTHGGHNLLSIGSMTNNSNLDYEFIKPDLPWARPPLSDAFPYAANLRQNAPWGIMLRAMWRDIHDVMEENTMFYGDLSLGMRKTPGNLLPSIELAIDKNAVAIGETVTLNATISDADAELLDSPHVDYEHQIEWFCEQAYSKWCHSNPTATTAATSTPGIMTWSYTPTRAHVYGIRAEVIDEWYARAHAIATVAVTNDARQPLRINAGVYSRYGNHRLDTHDAGGRLWLHDQNHSAGSWGWICDRQETATRDDSVAGTVDDALYQSARTIEKTNKPLTWKIPLPTGEYTVNLGFADLWSKKAQARLLNVTIEGTPVLSRYDVWADVGADTAVVKSFPITIEDGELTMVMSRHPDSAHPAFINTIEILPKNGGSTPTRSIRMDTIAGFEWEVLAPLDAVVDQPTNSTQTVHVQSDQEARLALVPSGNN